MIPLAPLFHSLLGGGNQFASGGLMLMAVGAVGASLRKIPAKIAAAIEHQFTLLVTIPDEIELHAYFLQWLHAKYPHKRLRTMALIKPGGDREATFGLAEGSHWFWYKGRPLVIRIDKADITKAVAALGYHGKPHRPETLTLRCLGRNKVYLENIFREVAALQKVDEDQGCGLQVMDGSSWTRTSGYLARPLESVILPEGVRETLMTDIRVFIESKDWYAATGIPYHRGYLLYGLPGSGKSSLVEGFAHHFKRDVYLLHLSGARDGDLPSLFSEVREGSILLLEDVDCVESTSKRSEGKSGEKSNVTLSGLLNVLDGLQAPSGVLYFLTTNHRDKLDPALIRPGRVDVQVEFGHATPEQAKRLYKVFCPEADETEAVAFAESHHDKTMAELQMVLMEQRNLRLHAQLEA